VNLLLLGASDLPVKIATEFADSAAQKDWKWLCMFLFILCTIGAIAVITYLVRKNEAYSKRLHVAFEANTAAQLKLAATLGENSTLICEAKDVIAATVAQSERVTNVLKDVEAELRRRPMRA
jgi:hypothetical protein